MEPIESTKRENFGCTLIVSVIIVSIMLPFIIHSQVTSVIEIDFTCELDETNDYTFTISADRIYDAIDLSKFQINEVRITFQSDKDILYHLKSELSSQYSMFDKLNGVYEIQKYHHPLRNQGIDMCIKGGTIDSTIYGKTKITITDRTDPIRTAYLDFICSFQL
jgi:hypothetical protein